MSACSNAPSHPATAPTPAAPADTSPRAPEEYVPAAGLRWLCLAQPRRIFRDSALRTLALEVVDQDRLDAFTMVTGVDLRELESTAIAGYDLGTLYVAALATPDGGAARARFTERLSEGAIVRQPGPTLYRIAGTRGGIARALVSVHDRLLAVTSGDPSLVRVAEAYALGRLKSPTALKGTPLSALPSAPSDALVVVYFPGPFTGEWSHAAHGLLAGAQALDVAIEARQATLVVTVTLVGDWPHPSAQAALEASARDLAQSSTGQLFGLDKFENVRIVEHLHQLTWSAELPAAALVAGLRAAAIANVPEMFGEPEARPTGSPVDPAPEPR